MTLPYDIIILHTGVLSIVFTKAPGGGVILSCSLEMSFILTNMQLL